MCDGANASSVVESMCVCIRMTGSAVRLCMDWCIGSLYIELLVRLDQLTKLLWPLPWNLPGLIPESKVNLLLKTNDHAVSLALLELSI